MRTIGRGTRISAHTSHRRGDGLATAVAAETSRPCAVPKPWVKIRARAGLANLDGLGPLRLHDLRHNAVSWDVSRGVGLEIAGKNVGHRSGTSTETYAHFAPDALKRAADERARAMRAALEAAGNELTSSEEARAYIS